MERTEKVDLRDLRDHREFPEKLDPRDQLVFRDTKVVWGSLVHPDLLVPRDFPERRYGVISVL